MSTFQWRCGGSEALGVTVTQSAWNWLRRSQGNATEAPPSVRYSTLGFIEIQLLGGGCFASTAKMLAGSTANSDQ